MLIYIDIFVHKSSFQIPQVYGIKLGGSEDPEWTNMNMDLPVPRANGPTVIGKGYVSSDPTLIKK